MLQNPTTRVTSEQPTPPNSDPGTRDPNQRAELKITGHATKRRTKKRTARGLVPAGAGEAADVGGREEVHYGAKHLVREHGEGAQRRLPPEIARRFHC